MIKLANRLNTIVESNTLRMSKLSRELQAQGKNVINLSLGEPDFQTPQHIKDAAKKAIDDGYTFYTPVIGYLDLRQAISDKFKNENGLNYTPDQIVVSTGAKLRCLFFLHLVILQVQFLVKTSCLLLQKCLKNILIFISFLMKYMNTLIL
jgi:aspartate/methionine/tyrosine aminotransferase